MSLDLALPPLDAASTLEFADARGFKDWLKLVPMINVRQAHDDIVALLDKLNRVAIAPLERLKMLELLREPVALLQEESTKRYLGKPFPLADLEDKIWRNNVRLWLLMSIGYRYCWQAALHNDAAVQEHSALCGQRAMRYAALLLREYHFAYRAIPPVRWGDMYLLYRVALEAGIATKVVKDSLNLHTEISSCDAAFVQALLLSAGNPSGMSVKQIVWTDRLLDRWSNQSALLAALPDKHEKGVLAINLSQPGDLFRSDGAVSDPDLRYLDLEPIAKSIKKRVKYLRAGESPVQLGLGDEYSAASAEAHLFALYQEWCDLPVERNAARRPAKRPVTQLSAGIDGAHLAISGKRFAQPDAVTEVRGRAITDMQIFGATLQHKADVAQALEVPPEFESWRTDNESAYGFKLTRLEPGARLMHNQLLAVRPRSDEAWICGSVRWLKEGIQHEIAIGLRMLPGVPRAIAVRTTGVNAHSTRFTPGLWLPAVPALKSPDSLLLPSGWFKAGRLLEIYLEGQVKRAKLDAVLERGHDFERISFSGELT